jgi:hypothetical protein
MTDKEFQQLVCRELLDMKQRLKNLEETVTSIKGDVMLLTHIDMAAARTRILDLQETVALLEQTVGVLVMKNTAPTAPWEQ